MFEHEGGARPCAPAEYKAGFRQLIERADYLVIGAARHCSQEFVRKFAADSGADLRDLLDLR
jgi:hypothetical protein